MLWGLEWVLSVWWVLWSLWVLWWAASLRKTYVISVFGECRFGLTLSVEGDYL